MRKSLGQRSQPGYSPWGHKELDMTEVTEHKHTSSNYYGPDIVLGDVHILTLLTL